MWWSNLCTSLWNINPTPEAQNSRNLGNPTNLENPNPYPPKIHLPLTRGKKKREREETIDKKRERAENIPPTKPLPSINNTTTATHKTLQTTN
ncbi:hypothetical protein L873DRAFT_1800168, partial [Choiromyces venosus 120613-1]